MITKTAKTKLKNEIFDVITEIVGFDNLVKIYNKHKKKHRKKAIKELIEVSFNEKFVKEIAVKIYEKKEKLL